MAENGIGAAARRKEDFRFITGKGTYTDDINRPNQTYAYILRSPVAHADIKGIDTKAAAAAPGVVAVFTGQDMADDGVGGPAVRLGHPQQRRHADGRTTPRPNG